MIEWTVWQSTDPLIASEVYGRSQHPGTGVITGLYRRGDAGHRTQEPMEEVGPCEKEVLCEDETR